MGLIPVPIIVNRDNNDVGLPYCPNLERLERERKAKLEAEKLKEKERKLYLLKLRIAERICKQLRKKGFTYEKIKEIKWYPFDIEINKNNDFSESDKRLLRKIFKKMEKYEINLSILSMANSNIHAKEFMKEYNHNNIPNNFKQNDEPNIKVLTLKH